MTFDNHHRRYLAAGTAALVAAAGVTTTVGANGSSQAPAARTQTTQATTHHRRAPAHAAARTRIDRLTASARARYNQEVYGSAVHIQLRKIAHDRRLVALLQSGNTAALKTYVNGRFNAVWYHAHVSRMRIMKGNNVLVDAGVPFVVAPSQTVIRGSHGKTIGTLQVSIQDVIGFVRYMHRNFPVDIVARGTAPGHVRTSLPAAAGMHLPATGTVRIAGHRYAVRSFHKQALNHEPLTIWVLARS